MARLAAGRRRLAIATVLLLFIASVFIRLPNLGRPLAGHHEWLTSTVLRHQQIWWDEGALKNRFNPLMTYGNAADKNIVNQASNHKDAEGNYYYTSFPPFAYMLPYAVFKALGVYPEPLPLQVFNLFVHLVSVLFVYLTVELLTGDRYRGRLNAPAMLAAAIYSFTPGTLWYHSNVYMSDMFVQPLFIAGVYMMARVALEEKPNLAIYAGLAAVTFFMVYTEWIGVFFAVAVFIYAVFRPKMKAMRGAMIAVALSTAAAVALTVWQYSMIGGFDEFMRASIEKFGKRGSGLSRLDIPAWLLVWRHYSYNFTEILLWVALIAAAAITISGLRRALAGSSNEKRHSADGLSIMLFAAPVAIHHLVFFHFTAAHEFSTLKAGPLLAVLAALAFDRASGGRAGSSEADKRPEATKRPTARYISVLALTIILLFEVFQISLVEYLKTARERDGRYQRVGERIRGIARDDEVVFIRLEGVDLSQVPKGERDYFVLPQLVLYAHRNISVWLGEAEAIALIKRNGVSKGVVFTLDSGEERVLGVRRFSAY